MSLCVERWMKDTLEVGMAGDEEWMTTMPSWMNWMYSSSSPF
jgi:hypothetical protein